MDISSVLKDARHRAGMTQEQVAQKIMVSRVTVSHWENGKSLPDIVSLIKLSDLYGISLDDLVKGDVKVMEKVKKDARDAKTNRNAVMATAIMAIIVLVIYLVSMIVGGSFQAFCQAAVWWVLMGIGVVAVSVTVGQKKEDE